MTAAGVRKLASRDLSRDAVVLQIDSETHYAKACKNGPKRKSLAQYAMRN